VRIPDFIPPSFARESLTQLGRERGVGFHSAGAEDAIPVCGAFSARCLAGKCNDKRLRRPPFTNFSGLFDASACTRITSSVTFNFDTSNFSGSLSLSAGDTASLSEGVPPNYVPVFPYSTIWFNPPTNTYGLTSQLSGNFTLVDGYSAISRRG
jgi:hypothetical protein